MGLILNNRQNIEDVLDKEFNSITIENGILGVNNSITHIDIKCTTETLPKVKFDDEDDVLDLEDNVGNVDNNDEDDNYGDHI